MKEQKVVRYRPDSYGSIEELNEQLANGWRLIQMVHCPGVSTGIQKYDETVVYGYLVALFERTVVPNLGTGPTPPMA